MTQQEMFPVKQRAAAMRMLRCLSVAVLLLASASSAFASGLSISAADINWNWAVDGSPSPYMQIQVLNNSESDLLGGWTLDLGLQQVSGTGTLQFNSRSIAALGASYILNGNSSGLFGTISPTSIFAFDFDPGPIIGVTVPPSGKFLLDVNFSTPDNAKGVWNLVAYPGFTGWSNQNSEDREFTNVPFDGASPVVLGSIHVIPEPATLTLAFVGAAAIICTVVLKRKRMD